MLRGSFGQAFYCWADEWNERKWINRSVECEMGEMNRMKLMDEQMHDQEVHRLLLTADSAAVFEVRLSASASAWS